MEREVRTHEQLYSDQKYVLGMDVVCQLIPMSGAVFSGVLYVVPIFQYLTVAMSGLVLIYRCKLMRVYTLKKIRYR